MGLELTRCDVVSIQRVVDACQELWWESAAWQQQLVEESRRLIGAELCSFALAHGTNPLALDVTDSSFTERGDPKVRAVFADAMAGARRLFPVYPLLAGRLLRQGWCTATWTEHLAMADDQAGAHAYAERCLLPLGTGPMLHAACVLMPERYMVMVASRAGGARDFTQRERDIFTSLGAVIGARCGSKLSTARDQGPRLPRREREVLDRLLAGDSEKQIAAWLSLSGTTVHEYVSSLYRRFGVHSRGELMAYFIRREFAARRPPVHRRQLAREPGSGSRRAELQAVARPRAAGK